ADNGTAAFISACDWAVKNGFNFADSDVEVKVDVFARGVPATPVSCLGAVPVPACGSQCNTVRVTVSKGAPRLFTALPFFELPDDINVGAEAVAGLTPGGTGGVGGVGADQTVLLIDAQGWMGNGCNRNPNTCAIGRVRSEASNFVDTIAGTAGAQVGYAPYTQCYHPDLPDTYPCVSRAIVVDPTSAVDDLHAAIDGTEPISRGAANLCIPLLEAQRMFERVPSGGRRTVIFLSNGDNRYNHTTFWNDNLGYPPGSCRPFPFDETFNDAFGPCDPTPVPEERLLDQLTLRMADELKSDRIEIYVIALWSDFAPCGLDVIDSGAPDCTAVGDGAPDNIANERLLRCIASSPDHYFSVEIGDSDWFFDDIASEIVSRSLLQ
ncbi:MAG: VWA domain-containing protein, partial [Chloroflexi bacterium]|nr:VWA domain-containing protein [Chloroflexota bacterium]